MELDKAIGVVVDELEKRGLTDNTMIVLFGDHNAYYQSLSNYVKDIYPIADNEKSISELYRVPFMIKIGKGEETTHFIDKFTCTADIYPTILSLLGIKYYKNLTYGNSVFSKEESILYSRAYNVFLTDKIYFTTLKNIKWQDESVNSTYLADIEQRALILLKKISQCNRIFASDYFNGAYLDAFWANMRKINGLA